MLVAIVACSAMAAVAPEIEFGRMQSALSSFRRLAAAIPDENPHNRGIGRHSYKNRKAKLVTFLVQLEKVPTAMASGKCLSGQWSEESAITINVLTLEVADAGKSLAPFPEEALSWDRAALSYNIAHRRFIALQVKAGKLPQKLLDNVEASYEMTLRDYQETLARCRAERD